MKKIRNNLERWWNDLKHRTSSLLAVRKLALASFLINGVMILFVLFKFLGSFWKGDGVSPKYRSSVIASVVHAQQGKIIRSETYAGTIQAENAVSILSEFQGRIKEILFKDGDRVQKGDVLIVMEDGQAKAAVQAAEASLKIQAVENKKNKHLVEKGALSKAVLEASEARYDEAYAKLENTRLSLDATRIKAPFDGVMGFLKLSVGSHVSPNQEIARIVSDKKTFVEFQVPEKEIRNMRVGQEVSVLSKGFDLLPVSAKISAVSPYSDPTSHTVQVRAFLEEGALVQDGAFAEVRIDLGEEEQAVTVPQEAFESLDSDYIYVFREGRAVKKNVIKGYEKDGMVQIVHGLDVGEVVIVDPVSSLTDGLPVRVEQDSDNTNASLEKD
jgi:membrane fusion protein (multidrug efflux system)